MPIELRAAALSDLGRKREANEDTVYQRVVAAADGTPMGLFIVADGIGGRMAGQAASSWAVESIKNSLADLIDYRDPRATHRFNREELFNPLAVAGSDSENLDDRVKRAVEQANKVVREYARQNPEAARSAGTTLSMALVDGLQALVANVGDSRTYLLRDGHLRQVTKDHSLVQRLIDEGEVQASERHTHPQRNLVFRSLGADDTVKVDLFRLTLAERDVLLLCTDGLWEMVQNPARIAQIIYESRGIENACQRLVAAANMAGGEDNIGVVLAQVSRI